jgi:hypothetical protein
MENGDSLAMRNQQRADAPRSPGLARRFASERGSLVARLKIVIYFLLCIDYLLDSANDYDVRFFDISVECS